MNLLNEQMLKEAELSSAITKHNFYLTECKLCIGTQLMIKRECDLLYGYKKPCCKFMDERVENENKEINNKMLSKSLDLFINDL